MDQESPHIYDNVSVTFTKHDQGTNWRRTEFNHECWLLLLGFPNYYWSERHVQHAVGNFARVLLLEADERYKARLLVRARVKDVQKVPQFIVYEDPDSIDGDSWTVQCEVLQHKPQGEIPPPEDPIPENIDLEHGLPFDFFGLGQPVNGPNVQKNQIQGQQQGDWEDWPVQDEAHEAQDQIMQNGQNEGQGQGQEHGQEIVFNLNEIPEEEEAAQGAGLDLNQPPLNQDLDPVIINPVQAENQVYPGQEEEIQYLLQHDDEVFQLDPQQPQEPLPMKDEIVPQENIIVPVLQGPPLNLLDEEIPYDHLIASEDEDMEEDVPEQLVPEPDQEHQHIQQEPIPEAEEQNGSHNDNQIQLQPQLEQQGIHGLQQYGIEQEIQAV